MLTVVLKILGLAPSKYGKSGKREASWALMLIAMVLTIYAMWIGIEMVSAMTGVLCIIWPFAIGAMAGAYKLEHDVSKPAPTYQVDKQAEDALAAEFEVEKPQ